MTACLLVKCLNKLVFNVMCCTELLVGKKGRTIVKVVNMLRDGQHQNLFGQAAVMESGNS